MATARATKSSKSKNSQKKQPAQPQPPQNNPKNKIILTDELLKTWMIDYNKVNKNTPLNNNLTKSNEINKKAQNQNQKQPQKLYNLTQNKTEDTFNSDDDATNDTTTMIRRRHTSRSTTPNKSVRGMSMHNQERDDCVTMTSDPNHFVQDNDITFIRLSHDKKNMDLRKTYTFRSRTNKRGILSREKKASLKCISSTHASSIIESDTLGCNMCIMHDLLKYKSNSSTEEEDNNSSSNSSGSRRTRSSFSSNDALSEDIYSYSSSGSESSSSTYMDDTPTNDHRHSSNRRDTKTSNRASSKNAHPKQHLERSTAKSHFKKKNKIANRKPHASNLPTTTTTNISKKQSNINKKKKSTSSTTTSTYQNMIQKVETLEEKSSNDSNTQTNNPLRIGKDDCPVGASIEEIQAINESIQILSFVGTYGTTTSTHKKLQQCGGNKILEQPIGSSCEELYRMNQNIRKFQDIFDIYHNKQGV